MAVPSEPRIRYAIDPVTRVTVDAHAGPLPKKPYECIKCGCRLMARQGPVRTWHFAHFGGEEAIEDCPLYSGGQGQYENLLRELRTSEIETAEANRSIRLLLAPPPYGRSIRLYGVLPTVNLDEIPSAISLAEILGTAQIESSGLKITALPELFHPRNPEVVLELDPGASQFEIRIEMGLPHLALNGTWTGDGLREGDVFAGDPARAERVLNVAALGTGDRVFVVVSSELRSAPVAVERYRAGPWHIVSFDLEKSSAEFLEELSGEIWRNPPSFYADLVLPPHADPRSVAPVLAMPREPAVVAILPPQNMDPEFEVVSIPLASGHHSIIPRAGEGEPRWFRTSFPGEGSVRLSIHWADRHRTVHLHARSPEMSQDSLETLLSGERAFAFRYMMHGRQMQVPTWHDEEIRIPLLGSPINLDELGLQPLLPPGCRFDVIARFERGREVGPTVRRVHIGIDDLNAEMATWIREGVEEVKLDFDSLGSVKVVIEREKPWHAKPTRQELRKRLRKMQPLPKKARWSLVRELLGAPPGTSHSEFPSGISKLVRREFLRIRNERERGST